MERWFGCALACAMALAACKRGGGGEGGGGASDAGGAGRAAAASDAGAAMATVAASPRGATAAGGLLEPNEAKQLEAALLAELKAISPTSCVRDVLRGTPVPGPAAPDLLALSRGDEALAACFALFRTKESDTLVREVLGRPLRAGEARRFIPEARPLDAPLPETARAGAEAARKACGTLQPRISRIVQHGDACTPFLPGQLNDPEEMGLMRASRVATVLARLEVSTGPARAAVERLLDVLRLSQDTTRGGTAMHMALIASFTAAHTYPTLELVLSHPDLGKADLTELARSLDVLSRSELAPRAHLRPDRIVSELMIMAPSALGKDYVIPGGGYRKAARRKTQDGGPPAAEKAAPKAETYSGDERTDGILSWAAQRQFMLGWEKPCLAAPTTEACVAAIQKAVADAEAREKQAGPKRADPKAERRRIFDILQAMNSGEHLGSLLKRLSQRAFFIDAMRVHVAARLAALAGKPMDAAALNAAAGAYRDAFGDRPLRVRAQGATFVVEPQSELSVMKQGPVAYRFTLAAATR